MPEESREARDYARELTDVLRKPYALRVSYTRLDTYRTCPRKYKYIYLERAEQIPSEKMLIGQAVHSALETWVATGGTDLGDLMEIYDASIVAWKSEGEISPEEEQLARDMLIEYYDTFSGLKREKIVAIEQPFELYLENVCLTGIMDRVEWRDTGVLAIMDYKTGRSSVSQAKAGQNLQTAIYSIAGRELWPEAEHILTELVYPRLKKSVIHEFTDDELQQHRDSIRETAINMRLDMRLPPKGTPPICGNCSFKFTCGWGKKMDKMWQGILRKREQQ